MTAINKLRNELIRKIQQLSTDKLNEINEIVSKTEAHGSSKSKTLKLIGSWKDLDGNLFTDLTEKLHENRTHDRKID